MCDVNGQLVPSILHAGPSASPTGPASASVVATPITSTVPEQAADIRTRAQAVVGKANAAVKLDGSEEAQIVFNHVVSACSWRVDMCQDPFDSRGKNIAGWGTCRSGRPASATRHEAAT